MRCKMKNKQVLVFIVITVVYLFASLAQADQIKIAVIDTGFNKAKYGDKVNLCDGMHKGFNGSKAFTDTHGHGTHIAGLIAKNAGENYCLVIANYYNRVNGKGNLLGTIKAFEFAIANNVDIINYSGGGIEPSDFEKAVVKKALDKGIIVVAAAGNNSSNLKYKTYYPAMYDKRIVVVGNLTKKGRRSPSSNYSGPVDLMVTGTQVRSLNGKMTGTSQSAAIVSGRIAKELYNRKVFEHNYEIFGNVSTDNYWFEYMNYTAR